MSVNTDDVKNKLANRANNQITNKSNKPKTIVDLINNMKPEIERALPKHMDPDRIARIAITAVRNNPQLQNSSPISFIAALMQSSQLGLEPNTPLGQAYIIPFKNNKTNEIEAQFQIGYKGLMDLCRRSGEFKSIYAHEVYENDDIEFQYGLEKDIKHKPAISDRGNVLLYYAVYHLKDGGYDFLVMSKADIIKHRDKYSKAANKGFSPWQTDFDSMAKKTVIKQLLKYAPISIEVQKHLTQDESIKKEISKDMTDVENVIDITDSYEPVDDEGVIDVNAGGGDSNVSNQ